MSLCLLSPLSSFHRTLYSAYVCFTHTPQLRTWILSDARVRKFTHTHRHAYAHADTRTRRRPHSITHTDTYMHGLRHAGTHLHITCCISEQPTPRHSLARTCCIRLYGSTARTGMGTLRTPFPCGAELAQRSGIAPQSGFAARSGHAQHPGLTALLPDVRHVPDFDTFWICTRVRICSTSRTCRTFRTFSTFRTCSTVRTCSRRRTFRSQATVGGPGAGTARFNKRSDTAGAVRGRGGCQRLGAGVERAACFGGRLCSPQPGMACPGNAVATPPGAGAAASEQPGWRRRRGVPAGGLAPSNPGPPPGLHASSQAHRLAGAAQTL